MIADPATAGFTALLFALVLGLFEVVVRLIPRAKNSTDKVVVEWPNELHTLNAAIEGITDACARLEDAHKPIDGIAQWRRMEMQEDLLREIVDRTAESVTLQERCLVVLERIASWPPRREEEPDAKRNPGPPDDPSPR